MGGYDAYYTGEIRIVPPLTWEEIQAAPELRHLKIRRHEQVQDMPSGQHIKILGVAVEAVTTTFTGAYIEDDLQTLVRLLPGRDFVGHIEAWPDDSAPPWRHRVHAGRAETVTARLVWPGFDLEETPS